MKEGNDLLKERPFNSIVLEIVVLQSTILHPGPLNSSFFYPAETPESTEFFKNQSVKGRLGEITDIVPLANFLVSSEAGWVAAQTTQTIFINGGFLMR